MDLARDLFLIDPDDLCDALSRVDRLVADLEADHTFLLVQLC